MYIDAISKCRLIKILLISNVTCDAFYKSRDHVRNPKQSLKTGKNLAYAIVCVFLFVDINPCKCGPHRNWRICYQFNDGVVPPAAIMLLKSCFQGGKKLDMDKILCSVV